MAVFPKVRGRLTDELTLGQAEILGRYIGRMHMISSAHTLRYRQPLNLTTFGDDALDDLEKSGLIHSPSSLRYLQCSEAFLDFIDPLLSSAFGPKSTNTIPVHGDCHVGNILWHGDSPFLLDFDDMSTCLPVQDLWLIAPGRDESSLKIRDSLLKGYEQFSHFDDNELACVEALRALRMIHYTAWVAKRWSDPIFPKTFVQFGTDRFWQEETQALQEISELISTGSFQS
jgi:Ser/Thr protein kinase RdoA (MazF antagonist)